MMEIGRYTSKIFFSPFWKNIFKHHVLGIMLQLSFQILTTVVSLVFAILNYLAENLHLKFWKMKRYGPVVDVIHITPLFTTLK